MHPQNWAMLGAVVFTGLLMLLLGWPLAKGVIKPNHWYGFRTRKTLSDPEAWYRVNRVTGRLMIPWGWVIIGWGIIALWLPPVWQVMGFQAVIWGGVIWMLVVGLRAQREGSLPGALDADKDEEKQYRPRIR